MFDRKQQDSVKQLSLNEIKNLIFKNWMKKNGHSGNPKLKIRDIESFLKCNFLKIKFKNLKLNYVLSPS